MRFVGFCFGWFVVCVWVGLFWEVCGVGGVVLGFGWVWGLGWGCCGWVDLLGLGGGGGMVNVWVVVRVWFFSKR